MAEKTDYNVTENKEEWDRLRAKYAGVRLRRPPGDRWFSLTEMLIGAQKDARDAGTNPITRKGLQSRFNKSVADGDLEKYPARINNQSWYRETERGKERSAELID